MTDFKERRLPPFAWLSRSAIERLMDSFVGRERTVAVAIYTALATLSSEQRRGDHDGIVATRPEVARLAGVSDRTVDAYAPRLAKAGLLVVEHRRDGKLNLPNVWALIEPEQVANELPQGGEGVSPPSETGAGRGGEGASPLLKKIDKKEGAKAPSTGAGKVELPSDFPEQLRPHLRAVYRVLRDLAERHHAKAVNPLSLAHVVMARQHKPLVRGAYDYAAWADGKAKRRRDVVAGYRNWLDGCDELAGVEPAPGVTPAVGSNVVQLQRPQALQRADQWQDWYRQRDAAIAELDGDQQRKGA